MITKAIKAAWQRQSERRQDYTYWLVDCHQTILRNNYGGIAREFYPYANDCLKILSAAPDVKLILWTCSTPADIEVYLEYFKGFGINFDYVNENPEVQDGFGDYSKKLYSSVLMDDKAGFDGETDWRPILDLLISRYITNEALLPCEFCGGDRWTGHQRLCEVYGDYFKKLPSDY